MKIRTKLMTSVNIRYKENKNKTNIKDKLKG